jgi:glutamate synthase (NADPH/NADH) small chain
MLCSPAEIVGHDGFVTGIVANRMELSEPDESGRRAPVCVLDADFAIECDTVIIAVGTRPNPLLKAAAPGVELNRRGYVITDEDGATNVPGVFSGGDIVTGSATVILAMGAGKKSARAMDRWLRERSAS